MEPKTRAVEKIESLLAKATAGTQVSLHCSSFSIENGVSHRDLIDDPHPWMKVGQLGLCQYLFLHHSTDLIACWVDGRCCYSGRHRSKLQPLALHRLIQVYAGLEVGSHLEPLIKMKFLAVLKSNQNF